MRRLHPPPTGRTTADRGSAAQVEPSEEYAVPAGTPWLRANMVATVDGAATDANGRSAGISSAADRRVFHVLRSLADAVVVGARTAMTERYHRTSRPTVLLSRTLALDLSAPLLADPPQASDAPTIVIAASEAPSVRVTALQRHAQVVDGVELVLVPGGELSLAGALERLRDRGLQHLLCEGGPNLLAALVGAQLLDELCLTTSPVVLGGAGSRILAGAAWSVPQRWELAGLCEEDGSLFARWRPARST